MSEADCVPLPLRVQILQGDAWGHSGIRRHECRVLRQRQTMATWNQPELWWCVPNIRWVCTFHCSERLLSPWHPLAKNRLYPWIQCSPFLSFAASVKNCSLLCFDSRQSRCVTSEIFSLFSGKQKRRPQLQGGRDDWRAEVCRADGDQPVWDECKREHQCWRGDSLFCLRLTCLCGVVSGTCLVCRAAQLKAWIRQRVWMLCHTCRTVGGLSGLNVPWLVVQKGIYLFYFMYFLD